MHSYSRFRLLKYNYTIFTIDVHQVDTGLVATNQMLKSQKLENSSYEQKA